MSDYYGDASLEDWLSEEVFAERVVPPAVISLFEQWREPIEANIENWLDSDDGYGNHLSWRGWGRGFTPVQDDIAFDAAIAKAEKIMSGGMDNLRMRQDIVLVEPTDEVLEDTMIVLMASEDDPSRTGIVRHAGPGRVNKKTGKRMPMSVQVGDKVLIGAHTGEDHFYGFDGVNLLAVREADIQAVIE